MIHRNAAERRRGGVDQAQTEEIEMGGARDVTGRERLGRPQIQQNRGLAGSPGRSARRRTGLQPAGQLRRIDQQLRVGVALRIPHVHSPAGLPRTGAQTGSHAASCRRTAPSPSSLTRCASTLSPAALCSSAARSR